MLQEKTVDRVGGIKTIGIDVRVIAATHRDLEKMVREGTFREDLYYRLNVIPLRLQPLRERRQDIPLYLHHFLYRYSTLLQKGRCQLDSCLSQQLIAYDWPGNIRQLENAVEYMVNMAEGEVIGDENLPDYLQTVREGVQTDRPSLSLEQMLADYERSVLQRYYADSSFAQDKAAIANELKISLSTLYRKLEKYGLE